jgi:hypothetical protein
VTAVLAAGGDNDSHNYPTLIQADDGHLRTGNSSA